MVDPTFFAIDLTRTINIYIIVICFIVSIVMCFKKETKSWGGTGVMFIGICLLLSNFNTFISMIIAIVGVMVITDGS